MAKARLANLNDTRLFPRTVSELPIEASADGIYYGWRDGQCRPLFTWCFLVEFTGKRERCHPVFEVKDKSGKTFSIFFQVYKQKFEFWADLFVRGHTMAILYADRAKEKEYQRGIMIRQEELKNLWNCQNIAKDYIFPHIKDCLILQDPSVQSLFNNHWEESQEVSFPLDGLCCGAHGACYRLSNNNADANIDPEITENVEIAKIAENTQDAENIGNPESSLSREDSPSAIDNNQ
ncbi:hypothetical protein B7463_g6745, partial [Scytalidium lignicola]